MKNSKILESLGLSEQEARIYLALLKIGGSRASRVARETGLKRTTVYPILKSLSRKGFVTMYYRKSQQFYYAQKPARVAGLFERKLDAFTTIIPVLESFEKRETRDFGLRFIETKDELQEFYRGILIEYKGRSYRIISSAKGWEGIDPAFFVQFRKDRGAVRISTRLLLSADSKEINPTDPRLRREYRYLPSTYGFRSTIDIFDDKILVVSPEFASLAVVIAIPAMVDIFGSIFEMLWEVTPPPKK
ncbi:MAG: helix-turn-helix domain-containing protein [Candidatus Kerfeldbacteria bacterium]|nr:helix-turn-helix domain-containing protein [Candidatus Kerfeldbacteria bacterium]